jgi:hypothetical protein
MFYLNSGKCCLLLGFHGRKDVLVNSLRSMYMVIFSNETDDVSPHSQVGKVVGIFTEETKRNEMWVNH